MMEKSGISRADRAKQAFLEGCNCAQSVVSAFSDRLDCSSDTLLRLCSGLGGGIGRLRETCGAFLGAVIVLDGIFGSADPTDQAAKSAQYRRIQRLAEEFRRENGSLCCRQMLGLPEGASDPTPAPRTAEYYQKRPCPMIIYRAAALVEEIIRAENHENTEENGENFEKNHPILEKSEDGT